MISRRTRPVIVSFSAAALLLAACESERAAKSGALTAADFRAADAAQIAETAAMSERRIPTYRVDATDSGSLPPDFAVLSGAPQLAPVPPPSPTARAVEADSLMMDSLIGDINGAPIYATTFFEPVEARLIGLAAQHRNAPQRWTEEATKVIGGRLESLVRDQLLLAEARSSLSPEQKQGLLSFIDQVRKDLVSRGGGGQAAVDESLRDQGEKGLDAKLKENIDRQLIYKNLREKILPRVNVSWRDVEIEYERRAEKFNPSPIAHFRLIQIPSSEVELVGEYTAQLAAGTPFDELAERPDNRAANHGVYTRPFDGEFAKAEFFGVKDLNEAAQRLSPGEKAGPFEVSSRTTWVMLDRIHKPESKSLYEAQLEIYNELRQAKLDAEIKKYEQVLLGRQSMSELTKMADKLYAIATERYYTKVR